MLFSMLLLRGSLKPSVERLVCHTIMVLYTVTLFEQEHIIEQHTYSLQISLYRADAYYFKKTEILL